MFLQIVSKKNLCIYMASKVPYERKEKRFKTKSLPEAVAIISSYIIEGARDGKVLHNLWLMLQKS